MSDEVSALAKRVGQSQSAYYAIVPTHYTKYLPATHVTTIITQLTSCESCCLYRATLARSVEIDHGKIIIGAVYSYLSQAEFQKPAADVIEWKCPDPPPFEELNLDAEPEISVVNNEQKCAALLNITFYRPNSTPGDDDSSDLRMARLTFIDDRSLVFELPSEKVLLRRIR